MFNGKHILPTDEKTGEDQQPVHQPNYLERLISTNTTTSWQSYLGDVYEQVPSALSKQWALETDDLPYLNKLRAAKYAFPGLAHLISWMEVSTAVTRCQYLSQWPSRRKERAERVHVCQLDFKKGRPVAATHFTDAQNLSRAVSPNGQSANDFDARIYVVEDLSRSVIEILGGAFDVDPHFWKAQIDDYLWSEVTSGAVELRDLDVLTRHRPYFTLQYLRPRYYRSTSSFETATREAANFNVLRHLDSDRSRGSLQDENGAAAALMRAKVSLWIRPNKKTEQGVVGILLVDPTPTEGYRLWGGYSSFENWQSNAKHSDLPEPPRTSLYDDVIYWMMRMEDSTLDSLSEHPKTLVLPAFELVVSDWHHVIQYVTAILGKIEWEIAIPALRKQASGIDATMQKLHPWRRNVSLYRAMVEKSIDRIFSKQMQRKYQDDLPDPDEGLASLLHDFQIVLQGLDSIQSRIERIVSVATALLSIEEGRRAMDQNNNVARLTYLATLFIPLSFVSGFLSMQPDIAKLRQTYWIFFSIAIPLTALALLVADFGHIRRKLRAIISPKTKKI